MGESLSLSFAGRSLHGLSSRFHSPLFSLHFSSRDGAHVRKVAHPLLLSTAAAFVGNGTSYGCYVDRLRAEDASIRSPLVSTRSNSLPLSPHHSDYHNIPRLHFRSRTRRCVCNAKPCSHFFLLLIINLRIIIFCAG